MFFVLGFSIILLPTTQAKVTEVREVHFGGNDYSGIPAKGMPIRSARGRGIVFAVYEFKVDVYNYKSWGIANNYDGNTVVVKYVPFAPQVTFSSSTPYFVFSGFFLFLAVGVRSAVVWGTNIMNRHAS